MKRVDERGIEYLGVDDTNNAQASSSFHLLVIDNDRLRKEFLNE